MIAYTSMQLKPNEAYYPMHDLELGMWCFLLRSRGTIYMGSDAQSTPTIRV